MKKYYNHILDKKFLYIENDIKYKQCKYCKKQQKNDCRLLINKGMCDNYES